LDSLRNYSQNFRTIRRLFFDNIQKSFDKDIYNLKNSSRITLLSMNKAPKQITNGSKKRRTTTVAHIVTVEEILERENLFWKQERQWSNYFRDLIKQYPNNYLNKFADQPDDSPINNARRELRDFWNKVIKLIPAESELWHPEHSEFLLMKAKNHINLIEQFDEAVYRKLKYFEKDESGPYWAGHNRPLRYDFIDNLLARYNNGNSDPRFQHTTYKTKQKSMEEIMSQGLVSNDFLFAEKMGKPSGWILE